MRRGAKVRLIRDNVVIHEGTLSTLKRFKDEVREVQDGQECGMAFENYQDMQKWRRHRVLRVEEVQRTLAAHRRCDERRPSAFAAAIRYRAR